MLKRFLILASLAAVSQLAVAQGESDFEKPIEVSAGHEHFASARYLSENEHVFRCRS